LIQGRDPTQRVFLNRRHQPITRYGIHALVERYVDRLCAQISSLKSKRVSPHTIRHYLPFPTMSRDERCNSGSNWNYRYGGR
jgi:site-specific recombinase XerD